MTVSTTQSSQVVAGTGSTYTFAFSFIANSAADISVSYIAANGLYTLLLPSQYTLALNAANPNQIWGIGGTVTYPLTGSAIAAGASLLIQRTVPLTQATSISNQGNYYPQVIEAAMDTLCMEIQQIAGAQNRAIQIPAGDPLSIITTLPAASQRTSQFCGFDSSGNVIAALPAGEGVPISSAMQPVVEAATLQAATSLLAYQTPGTGGKIVSISQQFNIGFLHLSGFAAGIGGDDTTGVQAWINELALSGLTGWVDPAPSTTYNLSSQIAYSGSNQISIMGPGILSGAKFTTTTLTQNGFYFNCTGRIYLSGFGIVPNGTATAGAAIYCDGPALQSVGWVFDELVLGFSTGIPYIGLYSTGVGEWQITRCSFAASNICAYISSVGDSYISGNQFTPLASIAIGLSLYGDPGGARVVSNKWNSGVAYATAIVVDYSIGDGDVFFIANSIESYNEFGILLQQGANAITFGNVIVSDNEFSAGATSTARAIEAPNVSVSGGLLSLIINGNVMGGAQHGILIGSTEYANIYGNQCNDIDINSTVTTGTVNNNTIFSGGQINNASTSVIVINNIGYNPVGVAALSIGSSPWTYTASGSPETLYMSSSTSISSITQNGFNILPHSIGTNAVMTVELGPLEILVTTYSGSLSATKMIH